MKTAMENTGRFTGNSRHYRSTKYILHVLTMPNSLVPVTTRLAQGILSCARRVPINKVFFTTVMISWQTLSNCLNLRR